MCLVTSSDRIRPTRFNTFSHDKKPQHNGIEWRRLIGHFRPVDGRAELGNGDYLGQRHWPK